MDQVLEDLYKQDFQNTRQRNVQQLAQLKHQVFSKLDLIELQLEEPLLKKNTKKLI